MKLETKFEFGDKVRCLWAGEESPIYRVDGFALYEGGGIEIECVFLHNGEKTKVWFLESELKIVDNDDRVGFLKNNETNS